VPKSLLHYGSHHAVGGRDLAQIAFSKSIAMPMPQVGCRDGCRSL
jgi:hypothetical protein